MAGVEKPDPRLFEIALREAGCEPHELLHVGDSPESDVAGALNADVEPVLLDRDGMREGEGATVRIRSLAELPSLLRAGHTAGVLP